MLLAGLWRSVTRFDAEKVAPWIALRSALGVTVPLAVSTAFGAASAGLVISTGALNVSFSDGRDPYLQRAGRMLAASALGALGVLAGGLCSRSDAVAVAVSTVWAFAAGMLVALDTAAADIGLVSLITLVVFAAHPMSAEQAAFSGLLALAGGLLQTVLAVAFWPVRRYEPERRVLGNLYQELSRAAASPIQASQAPPASAQSTEARKALASLDRYHTIQGERYLSLLNQAERARLSILMLARLRTRLEREDQRRRYVEVLDRCFQLSSRILALIGDSLVAGETADPALEEMEQLHNLAEHLRGSNHDVMLSDVRFQMSGLLGQLRAALDLAAHATLAGRIAFERREAGQPWRLRLIGTWATLRANLHLESAAFRHAIRLSVCVAVADALGRGAHWGRSYWLPMTVAIVLKPDFTATFSRGVLRLVGTFVGLALATGLFHVLPPSVATEVALVDVMMFVLRCFGPANYGIFVTAVSGLIVLLLAITGVAPKEVIAERALTTAVGGLLALVAYGLWPTSKRTESRTA